MLLEEYVGEKMIEYDLSDNERFLGGKPAVWLTSAKLQLLFTMLVRWI
ncbi:hypothetical protein [Paenibacillus gansuensis]|uniref:Uncharacterized protein n=1 Tax=Paenibacillus gansuensis TaxID=306542 RepID=A0ABW5PCM6_9BACL